MPWNSWMRRSTERNERSRSLPTAPEGAGEEQPWKIKRDRQSHGADRPPEPRPEGPGWGERVQLNSNRHLRHIVRRGRRYHTNPHTWIRGFTHTKRMGRESRERGPTPAKPPTRTGPYPTRRALAAPLWAGRPWSKLTSTGRSGRRGNTNGSRHTWSGHRRSKQQGLKTSKGRWGHAAP